MSRTRMGEISSIPENVHFPSEKIPHTQDTQFAAKWTPKNHVLYHSTRPQLDGIHRQPVGHQLQVPRPHAAHVL